jgi:pimeloyl-ACP methyl ester carboxylesterase
MELREAAVDGRPVRYLVSGTGEPLFLVHGLSGSWRWWAPVVEALSAHRRVHLTTLPRPRHAVDFDGLSAWLAGWLDAAGVERADFAGHSLGGLFAAELAAREPTRVRRLVLVAPAGISCRRGLPRRALALLDSLYRIRDQPWTVVGDALRTGVVPLAAGVAFESHCDIRPELGLIRAPALLAWGERDRLVPVRLAEDWQRLLPRSRVVRLACGHVPMLEAPEQLARCMVSFLDEEGADDVRDQPGSREVDGVRLAGDHHEAAPR